jgi:hypothetical protein
MAAIINTVTTAAAVGNRETLSDIVSMITPSDTPIYTMAGADKLTGKHPEWEIDVLRTPAQNAQIEGDDYVFNAQQIPTRLGNYTQISSDSWIYSGTQAAVDNAGDQEKVSKAKIKAGLSIRKDVELAILTNQASVSSGTRFSGGLPSWLTTNVSRNSGSNGGYSSGTGLTVAETTGTLRALTKALMDTVMQSAFNSGGNVTEVVMSPYNKGVFVTFMSDANVATFRQDVMPTGDGKRTLIGTYDFYQGPFGTVQVKPDRVMATSAGVARRVFLLDPDLIDVGMLRPIAEDPDVLKTGDAVKGVILGEWSLLVRNEAGLGVIADVFGLTAST